MTQFPKCFSVGMWVNRGVLIFLKRLYVILREENVCLKCFFLMAWSVSVAWIVSIYMEDYTPQDIILLSKLYQHIASTFHFVFFRLHSWNTTCVYNAGEWRTACVVPSFAPAPFVIVDIFPSFIKTVVPVSAPMNHITSSFLLHKLSKSDGDLSLLIAVRMR